MELYVLFNIKSNENPNLRFTIASYDLEFRQTEFFPRSLSSAKLVRILIKSLDD